MAWSSRAASCITRWPSRHEHHGLGSAASPDRGPLIWPFFAWAAIGAAACAVLSALSIGVFVAPLAIIAMLALLRWLRSRTIAWFGAASGAGLVLLYIAYLNRRGAGEVCSSIPGGESCTTEWSPWPWFGVGIALFASVVAAFALARSRISR